MRIEAYQSPANRRELRLAPISPTDGRSIAGLQDELGQMSFVAAFMWAFCITIEPSARRHWPDSLISWTRFCAGKVHNPLVASHILAGVVAAMGFWPNQTRRPCGQVVVASRHQKEVALCANVQVVPSPETDLATVSTTRDGHMT